jgi:hypothetical protein
LSTFLGQIPFGGSYRNIKKDAVSLCHGIGHGVDALGSTKKHEELA